MTGAGAKLLEELAAVQPGHFVVAEDDVGRLVDNFEESVCAIGGDHYFAEGIETLGNEIADHGIVFGNQQLDGFGCSGRTHRVRLRDDFGWAPRR